MSKPIPAIDHYDNGEVRFSGANLDGKMREAEFPVRQPRRPTSSI